MTKVKICGITNLEDALLSAKFGADALGFNFYPKSPRYISPDKAREIIEQLPKEVLKVGVFVNESLERISEIASIAKLNSIQLHGEETPEFVREVKAKTNLEIIKAFRVSPEFKPEDVLQYEVDAILLDAYSPKEHGGTGHYFDWEVTDKVKKVSNNVRIYLAGGLSYNIVASAISLRRPYAVDACSKLESKKGKKDKVETINFITAVRNYDEILINSEKYKDTPTKREIIKKVESNFFYNLMKGIQTKPGLYIGKKSLRNLQNYLYGFTEASRWFGIEFINGFYPSGLSEWIRERLTVEDKAAFHFFNLILEECDDDERGFDFFFALLEEFKLEKEDLSSK